ncbi:MAG: XdhC family protein [Thermoanaerobaculia bacterium]|nr:XdhC family protein [Thermoanaerobaculia bacterium]
MTGALFAALERALAAREPVALATVLEGEGTGRQLLIWPGEQTLGDLGTPRLNQRAALFSEKVFADRESKRKALRAADGRVEVFFELFLPPPKLVVVGAVHVAIHLVEMARRQGFATFVVDPRTVFATPERFAAADELIQEWPQEAFPRIGFDASTYLAVLSHDLKIDLPALAYALRTPARYLGALGSSRTHAKRVTALEAEGFSAEEIARIHSPIGFDLGGRRAEEIALAVMAEIVAVRHGNRDAAAKSPPPKEGAAE